MAPSRLAAAAVAVAFLATACPDAAPAPPRERPPPAGTLRLGYPEEPPTLNPVTEAAPAATDILRAVLPSFFLITPNLRYRPYLLAVQPEVRREGGRMEVRFRIRADARWSDGRPITTRDVAFTWGVMADPDLEVARPQGFDHVRDVTRESATTGTLVLEPPLATWRDLFSAGRFVLPAHASDDVADWDRGPPVTAGPFTLGRWEPGRSVMLEADGRFFGDRPLVHRIEVAFVPDPTTAIQLLEAGLVDAVAPMLGVAWSRRLRRVPGAEVSGAFGADLVHLVLNASSVPSAGDRRRIADAIDRQRFVDVVVRDEGRPAHGVLAPEQGGAVAAWRRYGGEQAGPEEADELSLVYQRTELLDLLARFVHLELQAAGVDVELVPVEGDELWGAFIPQRRFDLAIVEWRGGPSPDLSPWVRMPGAAAPLTNLRDAPTARLGARVARGEPGALEEAQGRLAELVPVLPMFQPRTAMAWRAGITGLATNPSVDGPLWNAWAWSKVAAASEAA
ncbi:MAG: ABC transporter substrate-binding protein [Actinomycetota bacterium]